MCIRDRNFKGIFNNFAVFGVMAAGVAIVMIAGGFDLSIGSVAGFVGMLSSVLMLENFAVPTPLVFIIAIAIGCIFGLINGPVSYTHLFEMAKQ